MIIRLIASRGHTNVKQQNLEVILLTQNATDCAIDP
jgi:hypothetical protein